MGFGWTAAHLLEDGLPVPKAQASQFRIGRLEELEGIWPHFFVEGGDAEKGGEVEVKLAEVEVQA